MDRLDAMAVLLAVVEAGSLSAGARRLGAPLATVSRKVAELERHLGARLLLRTRRGLGLTEEGRAFVAASRRILEEVEAAEREAAGQQGALRGGLHVTAPVAFGERHLLPIALGFLREQPEIDLRLSLVDRPISLVEEHVDVALRIGHLADSALIATRVGQVRRVICASPAYLARRGMPRQPDDLAGHDGISFQGFATAPEWRYRGDSAAFAVEPHPKLAVNTTEAAIQAALSGLGILRVLSYQVSEELRSGRLLALLPDFAPAPLPVHLLHAPAGPPALKLRRFLDWAVPRLRARMAGLPAGGP
ncbi:LysR family transcriptional regulator [Roseomonas sp. GC11]|uniref:LysR family transcriptional regulator n=1 Tax=Roseomonas sp. GC11 TaxID=2950546 RepID=UPI00210CA0C6|nr:LysR family transcriptional regulator [Roseomonas sp. GC11]MCQ4158658.1 LysR family transcriptional regulator [Roseomonas sp. GC11]